MTARITPGHRRDTGLLVQGFARVAGRVTGTEPPAVFLTLGRHRRLFWGWLLFAGALMPGGRLTRRETELVILRVATLSGSDYELAQHRRLGRKAGLSTDEIDRVALGPDDPAWVGGRATAARGHRRAAHLGGPVGRHLGRGCGRRTTSGGASSWCCWSATTRCWPLR